MSDKNENNTTASEIVAWKITKTEMCPKYVDGKKVTDANGKDVLEPRPWTEIVCETYTIGELDFGNYWDAEGGSLFVTGDNNEFIETDESCYCDRAEVGGVLWELKKACHKAGDFAECPLKNAGETLRVEALGSRPHISRENTIKQSDLSEVQMTMVKVYGEPLFKNGTIRKSHGNVPFANYAWKKDIREVVGGIIAKQMSEAVGGGEFAVVWHWDDFSADYASLACTITAESEDKLREGIVKVFGIVNAEELRVRCVSGNGDKVERVTAKISMSGSID